MFLTIIKDITVVHADYKFRVVDIGAKERESDGGLFGRSKFGSSLEANALNVPQDATISEQNSIAFPHVFVADDAFPHKSIS